MNEIWELASDEPHARLLLALATAPGDQTTGALVAQRGAVETIRLALNGHAPDGETPAASATWCEVVASRLSFATFGGAVQNANRARMLAVFPGDRWWPAGLDDLGHAAPLMLWAKGDLEMLTARTGERVTLTGSRAASEYGMFHGRDLGRQLAGRNLQVVSGGAHGIDTAAHEGALARDMATIAVLPSGLDHTYPAVNHDLHATIADRGLLISEMPPGARPSRTAFLARNRILAALSGATVIVEAANRSGAMHAATRAAALGRQLGALPGPVTSVASAGSHQLIKEGTARLVTDAADIAELLEHPSPGRSLPAPVQDVARSARSAPPADGPDGITL